jgi:hypothetical protein
MIYINVHVFRKYEYLNIYPQIYVYMNMHIHVCAAVETAVIYNNDNVYLNKIHHMSYKYYICNYLKYTWMNKKTVLHIYINEYIPSPRS